MAHQSFFSERHRRHLILIALTYAVTAWLLLVQLGAILLPTFEGPHWVPKALVALLILLFPAALILAWAFESPPEGVQRTVTTRRPCRPMQGGARAASTKQRSSTIRLLGAFVGAFFIGFGLVAQGAPVPDAETAPAPSTSVHIVRIHVEKPIYPSAAISRGVQGCVTVQFDINKKGRPTNLQVWTHYPSGIFDQAAIQTISRWRFRATSADGKTIEAKDVFQEINFIINEGRQVADTLDWVCAQPPPRTLIVAAAPAGGGAQGIAVEPQGKHVDLLKISVSKRKLMSGWVKATFCVGASGEVRRPRVVDASPRGLYDAAVIRAMLTWQFTPRKVDGRAVKTCGLKYTIPIIAQPDLAKGPVAIAQGPIAINLRNLGPRWKDARSAGKVLLRFCVGMDGSVTHVQVVRSRPKGVFDGAAVNTIHAWKLLPMEVHDKPIRTCNVTQWIVFRLGQGGLLWGDGDPRQLLESND